MAKAIERISLQSEIIKYIQSYISDHHLKPGDKLPSQGQFLEMMNVSRTSLREAVKTLEAWNVIEVQNGKGLYVGNKKEKNDLNTLLEEVEEKKQLLEIVEARRALETEIIAMVIHKATEDELEDLGKIEQVLLDKYHRGLKQTAEDREFHHTIYRLCHNKILYSMICMVDDSLNRLWSSPLNMYEPFTETIPDHEKLYFAIRERNVAKALKMNNRILDSVCSDISNK